MYLCFFLEPTSCSTCCDQVKNSALVKCLKKTIDDIKASMAVTCIKRILPLFLALFMYCDMCLDVFQTNSYHEFANQNTTVNNSSSNGTNGGNVRCWFLEKDCTATVLAFQSFNGACIVWALRPLLHFSSLCRFWCKHGNPSEEHPTAEFRLIFRLFKITNDKFKINLIIQNENSVMKKSLKQGVTFLLLVMCAPVYIYIVMPLTAVYNGYRILRGNPIQETETWSQLTKELPRFKGGEVLYEAVPQLAINLYFYPHYKEMVGSDEQKLFSLGIGINKAEVSKISALFSCGSIVVGLVTAFVWLYDKGGGREKTKTLPGEKTGVIIMTILVAIITTCLLFYTVTEMWL